MVDAKQTIRDTSIWGGGVKRKFGVGGQKKKQEIMFASLLT
jgi:hypothetical protein